MKKIFSMFVVLGLLAAFSSQAMACGLHAGKDGKAGEEAHEEA